MQPKAYEEVVDLIANGPTPQDIAAFEPSQETRGRVWDLVERKKAGDLSAEESSELQHYLHLEHILRLTKARARQHLRTS